MDALLSLNHITKLHPGKEGSNLLSDISADVGETESIAILGASGQGKTTLLRIVASLERADQGRLALQDVPLEQWQPERWRKQVCYVAQHPVMLTGTIEDNLKTVSFLHKTAFDETLARNLMLRMGLEHLDWSKSALELSGGEKQRLSLVRSLLLQPKVLLLDEVTASLDANSKEAVESVMASLRREQKTTLIWITHETEQARRVSSRVWFLSDNRLQEDMKTEAFFERPLSAQARSYLQLPQQRGE